MGLKDYFEIGSYMATMLMGIVACVALVQILLLKAQVKIAADSLQIASESLKTAKEDILIRSRREAVALAADRCEKFSTTVEQLKTDLAIVFGQNAKFPEWRLSCVSVRESSLVDHEPAAAWSKEICSSAGKLGPAIHILNTLEAFAIYFESGAADEKTAFPVTAAVFCGYIRWLFPLLVKIRKGTEANVNSGEFPNAVALYERWAARLRTIAHEQQTAGINQRIAPPIGVN